MKKLLTILILFFSLLASAGKPYAIHNIEFPASGHLVINPTTYPAIAPGDLVYLKKGAAANAANLSLEIQDMNGTAANKISITNDPSEQLVFNKVAWVLSDGWGTAIKTERCSYLVIYGTNFSGQGIWIKGPTTASRSNYFGVQFLERSEFIELYNLRLDDGGTHVQWKTFVTSNSNTWRGTGTVLGYIKVHDLVCNNSGNETIYGGNTAVYERYTTGTVWQPSNVNDPIPAPSTEYKKPLRYQNCEVYNVTITGSGNDALQFANIEGLTVRDITISGWGANGVSGHLAAILIGGGVTNSAVSNVVAQNSTNGEGIWHFAEGAGHTVNNVLIYNVSGNLCFIKGGEHLVPNSNYHVTYSNVTFCKQPTWAVGVRNNGIMGGTAAQTFNNCLIIEVGDGGFGGGTTNPRYFYVENGAAYTEGTAGNANGKYNLVSAAQVDVNNYCQPIEPGSPVDDEGYRRAGGGGSSSASTRTYIKKRAGRSRYKLIQQ